MTLFLVLAVLPLGCYQDSTTNANDGAGGAAGMGGTAMGGAGGTGGVGGSVDPVLSALTIAGAPAEFAVDDEAQLTATASYDGGDDSDQTQAVTWTSSDPQIAAFDENTPGLLRAVAPGQVTVTATLGDVSSDGLEVAIAAPAGVLSATPADISGLPGETFTLQVTDTLGEEMTDVSASVSWASSDEAIVSVVDAVATIQGAGTATLTGTFDGRTVTIGVDGIACNYPENDGTIAFGQVFPDLMWRDAYRPDGTQMDFSLSQFYCSPQYADKNTLIVVLGAGWCGPCSNFTANILNPQAEELVANGAQILFVEAQDTQYELATSFFAYRHIGDLIQEGPGVRVGEQETMVRQGNDWVEAPGYVQGQDIVTGFPSVWVLRKRDMVMIADQGRSNYYLPFSLIVADPDADWSNPPPPPFRSNCEEGDEELSEPNNTSMEAARVTAGVYPGGICDAEPDFYRHTISGNWRATLEFDSSEADLDIFVFDKRTGQPKLDENGMAIGSNGTGSVETFEHSGASIIMIYGYNRTSTPYTLTLEEL
jgi:thiol-disulfide isomerase/thioredoxin